MEKKAYAEKLAAGVSERIGELVTVHEMDDGSVAFSISRHVARCWLPADFTRTTGEKGALFDRLTSEMRAAQKQLQHPVPLKNPAEPSGENTKA